jgi:hypothetical protein
VNLPVEIDVEEANMALARGAVSGFCNEMLFLRWSDRER